jgi:hypothetical protein
VTVDALARVLTIERFQGYFGRGYDAIGEYDYFADHFLFRGREALDALTVRSA